MKVKELHKKAQINSKAQKSYFKDIVLKGSENIIDILRNQLYSGYLTEKAVNYRATYSSQGYKEQKQKMNTNAGGFVDLRYTGSFYSKMYLANNNIDYFAIRSKVIYIDSITDKFGRDSLTFGGKSLQHFTNDIVKPQLLTRYKNALSL